MLGEEHEGGEPALIGPPGPGSSVIQLHRSLYT